MSKLGKLPSRLPPPPIGPRIEMKPHVPPSDKDRWRQLVKLWRVLACGSECGYPHLERRNVIKLESRRHAKPPART
jgi:hypothetical protein